MHRVYNIEKMRNLQYEKSVCAHCAAHAETSRRNRSAEDTEEGTVFFHCENSHGEIQPQRLVILLWMISTGRRETVMASESSECWYPCPRGASRNGVAVATKLVPDSESPDGLQLRFTTTHES